MLPFFREEFGNPSAIYSYGMEAKNAMEEARRKVAKSLGAMPTEIFFTSGGTESDIRAASRGYVFAITVCWIYSL
jgi:cysteine desulfurase